MPPARPKLYLIGEPGRIGGASTKLSHLIRLLKDDFDITLVFPDKACLKNSELASRNDINSVARCLVSQLPSKMEGVALGVCDPDFFAGGRALLAKSRGLKVVWSNEMMWSFRGEAEAVKNGLVDRVLFVSDFQAQVFRDTYAEIPSFITGNYIDAEDFAYRERRNSTFTIGRLSRADPVKYPLNFPVFYEDFGLKDVNYRVMAWSADLSRIYKWHSFGPEWQLLSSLKESSRAFLYTLDAFVYPLGHSCKESWGRAVVEAMLTGLAPIVPCGHNFSNLIAPFETGFLCGAYDEWKRVVLELHADYARRVHIGKKAAEYARDCLCNKVQHRAVWMKALTF